MATATRPKLDNFSSLPDELIFNIFLYLRDPKRCHCLGFVVPLVCRRWYTISNDPQLWTQLNLNNFKLSVNQIACFFSTSKSPNVKVLHLNLLSDEEFDFSAVLESCQRLECLKIELWDYRLYDSRIFNISCRTIQHIALSNIGIGDEGILILCKHKPQLVSLEIRLCRNITAVSLAHLADHLNCLQVLLTEFLGRGDSDLRFTKLLNKHKNHLQQLEVEQEKLSESAFIGIDKCKKLVKLSVNYYQLSDRFLTLLCELPCLAYLKLQGNFTENCWLHFLHRCSLRALNLISCPGITDAILEQLAINSPHLYFLTVYGHRSSITDRGLRAIVRSCPKMEILVLHNMAGITSNPLLDIPQRMPRLRWLCLFDCPRIGDSDLQQLGSLGVPMEIKVTFEDPFGNLLCRHHR